MFIVKINKSCVISYIGIIFGVLASFFAFNKVAFVENGYLRYSLVCLIIAGVCDMFDGKIARMCKRTNEEKEFGIQLDSLADTFNFLAVPVIIMFSLGMDSLINVISYALFMLCGIARLAFFNTSADMDNPVKYYKGLPVTATAIIYPLLGLLRSFTSAGTFSIIYLVATFLIAFLFVFNFKCPKLKGIFYTIIPILALILIALLFFVK